MQDGALQNLDVNNLLHNKTKRLKLVLDLMPTLKLSDCEAIVAGGEE